jgi:hypothetical protein
VPKRGGVKPSSRRPRRRRRAAVRLRDPHLLRTGRSIHG